METKNIVISKEYIDKIRRFAAIRPEETFVYIPEAFRDMPEELRPKFTLRPISGEDALRYSDAMRGEVTVDNGKALISVKRGEYTISVVKNGLVSWSNFYDTNGRVVEYTPNALANLSLVLMEELSSIITSRSGLTEEEVLGLK
jgi:hypothetical protein